MKHTFIEDRGMSTDTGRRETCSQDTEECYKGGERMGVMWDLGFEADILQNE